MTLIDSIIEGLAATSRCSNSEVPPAAVLWTDAKSEWLSLLDRLRERLPQLLTYGEYNSDRRTGPAIWLKCAMDNMLPEVTLPPNATPVIYLPGVSRQDLRAGSQCPRLLQPLVELLYRGAVWIQKNGKDWTVEAMLVAKERPGLGLDVASDNGTRLSMMASLSVLADVPASQLLGRRLEAEDFDRLMIGDHPRDLLRWMSNGDEVREEMDAGRWHAFRSRCRDEYGFDPESDGEIVAAERFGLRATTAGTVSGAASANRLPVTRPWLTCCAVRSHRDASTSSGNHGLTKTKRMKQNFENHSPHSVTWTLEAPGWKSPNWRQSTECVVRGFGPGWTRLLWLVLWNISVTLRNAQDRIWVEIPSMILKNSMFRKVTWPTMPHYKLLLL
jgi:hypothetical protein